MNTDEIKYEKAPLPERAYSRDGLTEAIRNCPDGESFEWPRLGSAYSCARMIGVRIKTQIQDNRNVRIWRLAAPFKQKTYPGAPPIDKNDKYGEDEVEKTVL